VFGVPVGLCGAILWVALVGLVIARRWVWALRCGSLAVGAALWFVFVQAAILKAFCPWCMIAHVLGLVVTGLLVWTLRSEEPRERLLYPLLQWVAGGLLALGLAQVYGPAGKTHRLTEVAPRDTAPVHARGPGPKARFANGSMVFDVAALPHLGPADAPVVMVEYFDYTCAACREMHGFLEALLAKYPERICLITLPVPLEHRCNPALPPKQAPQVGACETARLALTLWRKKPADFPELHEWLLQGRSTAEVKAWVLRHLSEQDLAAALDDPWIGELILANARAWQAMSRSTPQLPKLLFANTRVIHGLASGEDEFIRVMEKELKLRP
jgi:protein-disulfide isomerase